MALPDNWECDICTIVAQRRKRRIAEMKSRVIQPKGAYDYLVAQCKRPNNLSINLKRL